MKQINVEDLDDLAVGATILGSGGGGDPVYDLMMAKLQVQISGRPICLVDIEEIETDALVAPVGFMGAPLVSIEKLPSCKEFKAILRQIEIVMGKPVSYLLATEIGGANALPPMLVSAQLGIPVIDGDSIGRAFPELHISSCNVMGVSASPAFLADAFGNVEVVRAPDALGIETKCRKINMKMGSYAALSFYLMSGKIAKNAIIPGTVSKAIAMGRVRRESLEKGLNPIECLMKATDGKIVASGIISDIEQSIKDGFLQGHVRIDTDDGIITIAYQNEFLMAYKNGKAIASTPDIISILEFETGLPISSESLAYGLRVVLVVLPGPEIWKTTAGLALTAPHCFGYSVDFEQTKN